MQKQLYEIMQQYDMSLQSLKILYHTTIAGLKALFFMK